MKKEDDKYDNVYIPRPLPLVPVDVHVVDIIPPREPPPENPLCITPQDGCIAPPNSPVLGPVPCNTPCETELTFELKIGMDATRSQALGARLEA